MMKKNKSQNVGFDILDQTQRKKGYYNPSIEFINNKLNKIIDNSSDVCGVTLTFRKSYHNDDDKYIHKLVISTLKKSRIWKNKNYILFPEYTKNGVLHYHGIIWDHYQSEVMSCVKWWRRKYGFVKPELELKNRYRWIEYITKNYGKTGLWTIMSDN